MRAARFWASLTLSLCVLSGVARAEPADLIVRGGRIWTGAADGEAQAIAVREGRLVYVGSNDGSTSFQGPKTRVVDLKGRFVLPGLVDAHVHPTDIVDLPVCDLDSRAVTLRQLSAFVRACLKRQQVPPGGRLLVHQWNYSTGNQPDADYPTLRVALDRASRSRQVQLLGNDAHHGAFNSLGLAAARTADGRVVGYSKQTLANEFAAFRGIVGVDASGEPNGAVNEDARYAINPRSMVYIELDRVMKAPEAIPERLNRAGITAINDAMADPDSLALWDTLLASHRLTVRTTLSQFYDPARFHRADGSVDFDTMVAKAQAVRAKYAGNPLLRADMVKIFADGVLEGNPFANPPTLPNGAVLEPFLQPRFATDAHGHATVVGYVDTQSSECRQARETPALQNDAELIASFVRSHGFHPAQCIESRGQLQHPREVILEFAKRFHAAGFNLHIHAIGDRAVRTAVDAIEGARNTDGNHATRDGLAHIQYAHPDDVKRIGQEHLYIAYTYAWANVSQDYDLTVLPFLMHVEGNSTASLHPPGNVYDANAYPVRATRDAGAILAAGSDAPVETRDPRPFVNIAMAVMRALPGQPALGPAQAIPIEDALKAYTLNGARWLGIDREAGSLEVGKSADFIVIDRDPLKLAAEGRVADVAHTKVLSTWFEGRAVYRAKANKT